ncbi:MAG: ATP-binding protein [Planctomycetota bacterium]|jgi:MinD superfamily P-loop ATPase|nr:ATP-binding protein [Planctomycetota bacterium]
MQQVSIVSGKGGVGKTSICAALVHLLAPVCIVDGDVDASDLPLVIPHQVLSQERVRGNGVARLNPILCYGCGACERACRFDAISVARIAEIDETACEGCGACALVCPAHALALEPREQGTVYQAETTFGPMCYARLDPGAENSGKLVSEVRARGRRLAEQAGIDLVLIDGPPGVGCPTTAAISGTDLVVAVCEPSVTSVHDVHRLLDLVEHFDVPAIAVINKADIDSDQARILRSELDARMVGVVANLPYAPAMTEAQIRGTDVIDLGDISVGPGLEALASAITRELRTASV